MFSTRASGAPGGAAAAGPAAISKAGNAVTVAAIARLKSFRIKAFSCGLREIGPILGSGEPSRIATRAAFDRARIICGFSFQIKGLAMPIYAYRCVSCGHAKDVLQKLSDPLLTTCPSCGAATFVKQLTAAGFQLKGSGWYVTDFKGGPPSGKPEAGQSEAPQPAASGEPAAKAAESAAPAVAPGKADTGPAASPSPAPAAAGPAPSAK